MLLFGWSEFEECIFIHIHILLYFFMQNGSETNFIESVCVYIDALKKKSTISVTFLNNLQFQALMVEISSCIYTALLS